MQQIQEDRSASIIGQLEETECSYCETGTLESGSYKGNQAVLCTECGVPALQTW